MNDTSANSNPAGSQSHRRKTSKLTCKIEDTHKKTSWIYFDSVVFDPPSWRDAQEILVSCRIPDPNFPAQDLYISRVITKLTFLVDGSAFITDFQIPSYLQASGVARFIWYQIYQMLHPRIQFKASIHGKLSGVDEKVKENQERRDQLWKDLIGFGVDKDAIFESGNGNNFGYFKGMLYSVWNPYKAKFKVLQLETTN